MIHSGIMVATLGAIQTFRHMKDISQRMAPPVVYSLELDAADGEAGIIDNNEM